MANNYLQFSEVIKELTEPEEKWLKEQLQETKNATVDAADDEDSTSGSQSYAFLRDKPEYDAADCDSLGFDYDFHDDDDMVNWGHHLWVYAEECGNADNVAWLVQKFLKKFRPKDCWGMTYAVTCSKMRVDEFGGGAVFVTADRVRWNDCYDFICRQTTAHKARQKPKKAKK